MFTWTKHSPSPRNMLSKTCSFLHNQTPVFQQEQLPSVPLPQKLWGHPAATSCVCQRRGPNTDSPQQCLLWSPAPQGQALGREEELGLQHFSLWDAQARGNEAPSQDIPVICRLTLISQPVHRTDLLMGLVRFSNQVTSQTMLFNVTSESFEPLILLYCIMKYILKRFGSFCNR